jgi:hypothetical protein
VFIIDPENGLRKGDALEFSRAQANIIPLEKNGQLCYCGITQEVGAGGVGIHWIKNPI